MRMIKLPNKTWINAELVMVISACRADRNGAVVITMRPDMDGRNENVTITYPTSEAAEKASDEIAALVIG